MRHSLMKQPFLLKAPSPRLVVCTALVTAMMTTFSPSQPVAAQELNAHSPLTIETSSEKVPVGTMLRITFNVHMDSRVTQVGEPFTAFIQDDFTTHNASGEERVILPEGSMVRGRVSEVKKPGLFSRGGAISLAFDHVVLPSGELLPLELNLSTTENAIVNQKGALYSDPGVKKKMGKGVQEGVSTFDRIKDAGIDMGKNTAGGFGVIVTAPVALAGGAIAGSAVTTGKTVVALVGRGDSILIQPGDTVTIDFGGSFNLPAE